MSERLKFQGKLAEKELAAKRLENLLKGSIVSLRDLLDPTEKIEDLQSDIIAEQAVEFANKHIEYRETLAEIKAIKKALGKE